MTDEPADPGSDRTSRNGPLPQRYRGRELPQLFCRMAKFDPVADIALLRQLRKMDDANAFGRLADESGFVFGMQPPTFVIVSKDDDVAADEVVREAGRRAITRSRG